VRILTLEARTGLDDASLDEPRDVRHRHVQVQREQIRDQQPAARNARHDVDVARKVGKPADHRVIELRNRAIIHATGSGPRF
jgi:hypothetical protein